jgi:hypothetical protein
VFGDGASDVAVIFVDLIAHDGCSAHGLQCAYWRPLFSSDLQLYTNSSLGERDQIDPLPPVGWYVYNYRSAGEK